VARSKNPLTTNDYVTAAVKLVKERGLSSMTMRALGDEMGVDATALYRHFPNKESLIDAMIDWLLGQAIAIAQKSDSKPPRDRIVAQAKALRSVFEEYPDIGLSMMHSEGSWINGLHFSQRGVEVLRELGLSGLNLVRGYQAIEGFIMGSCVHDFAGSPHNMEMRRMRYRYFEVPEFDEYSHSAREVRQITEDGFDLALDAILDQLEAQAKNSSSRTRKKSPSNK
jgi:AcrR family transcriptional regulator